MPQCSMDGRNCFCKRKSKSGHSRPLDEWEIATAGPRAKQWIVEERATFLLFDQQALVLPRKPSMSSVNALPVGKIG